ncbi:MAG: SH3 domain-containing protein [Dehalococcoidia bacterium]
MSRHSLRIAAVAFAAAVLVSCGGKSGDPEVPPLPTATPRGSTATAAASPTPSPSPTPDPAVERQHVIDAASAALDGALHISPLTLPACLDGNPERKPCIELKSEPDQLVRGLARFNMGDPDGGGATFLMGRMAGGDWAFWQGSQQQSYVLDALPGDLIACGTDEPATIRSSPAPEAAVIRSLDDLTELTADGFTLTRAGNYAVQGERGEGWYHVTDPVEGWIDAIFTTDAVLGDCLLHDAIEGVDRG